RRAQTLTASETAALVASFQAAVVDVLFQHGGALDRLHGGEVAALFGAPVAHKDHAQRALEAALAVRAAVAALGDGRAGQALTGGIGVASGEATVGLMGPAERAEYTALGDVVEAAAGLVRLTRPGSSEILVAERTYRLVSGIECEALPALADGTLRLPHRVY